MNLIRKHSALISIVFLIGFPISIWIFPSARLLVILTALVFSVIRALASVIAKHRAARLQGRSISIVFVRIVLVETLILLSVMVLAGFLGRHIAQFATQQISSDFIQFAAGIATGLLVGAGVGIVMLPILGRFIRARTGK